MSEKVTAKTINEWCRTTMDLNAKLVLASDHERVARRVEELEKVREAAKELRHAEIEKRWFAIASETGLPYDKEMAGRSHVRVMAAQMNLDAALAAAEEK